MEQVLFTGSTGFLGKNILPNLSDSYQVETLGIEESNFYRCNISSSIPNLRRYYDVVFHAAGKAHSIPKTQEEEQVFFDVNFQGTVNLCKALEKVGIPQSFIFISTVAVYGLETGINIDETYPLNGNTPYALSKIKAEKFLMNWCDENGVILGILRPSLIAGQNPPGNLGAMINGIKTGKYFSIAGGKAKKSVLMVQDIANLIPKIIDKGGIYNVCDDSHPSFRDLEGIITRQLNKKEPINVPFGFAKILALLGDLIGNKAPINSLKLSKITKDLTFSNAKAKEELNWQPLNVLENFKIN